MPSNTADPFSGAVEKREPSLLAHSELMAGSVYAVGIETAAGRLPMILMPMLSALQARRPCVLITRLGPRDPLLSQVLAHARQVVGEQHAGAPPMLQVFSAVGDYAVNLFLHGSDGYLAELDGHGIAAGSLLVIDEADDLYTLHDHGAVVQQARTYREWCERHGHSMLQLHLRTGPHRPLLDGNQAATQHLSGLGRVTAQAESLRLSIDFWTSASGVRIGRAIELEPLPRSPAPAQVPEAPCRPQVWFVGQIGDESVDLREQFAVRRAASVAEVLRWSRCERDEGVNIVVTLDPQEGFSRCVEQLAELRAAAGDKARIVVRESGYRLRQYTQRPQLLRAGVDLVMNEAKPLRELAPLLQRPRRDARGAPAAEAPEDIPPPWTLEAEGAAATEAPNCTAFVIEAERRMRTSDAWHVPYSLVEVEFDEGAITDADAAASPPRVGRENDLALTTPRARFFFLQGCCGRDGLNAVTRGLDDAIAGHVRRIHLYSREAAIAERLNLLRSEAAQDTLRAEPLSPEKASSNVVTMASASRVARSMLGPLLLVAMSVVGIGSSQRAHAQGSAAATDSAATVGADSTASKVQPASSATAYAQGRYQEAARLGLAELVREPSNHELRLRVANSLAWTGRYREATEQYERLAGTPLARAASVGLAGVNLWSGRPHMADPLYRQALAADPTDQTARDGLANAQRQLRPRTTLRGAHVDDSSRTERRTVGLAHRWRDESLLQVFELAGEHVEESRSPDGPALQPRKASFEYQHLGLSPAPRVRLSSESGVRSSLFAELSLRLADGAATVEFGRVNWGEIAFAPDARRDGLFARRVGLAGRFDTDLGAFVGSASHFAVSDGNGVHEFNAQFTPAWQPFEQDTGLRASAGVYGRKAERHDTRYWSPASGYYVAQVGLGLNRWGDDWNLSAELKRSVRLGAEGASGWTFGIAGVYWLNADWAMRLEGLHLETRRDDSAYRSTSIALSLDRSW